MEQICHFPEWVSYLIQDNCKTVDGIPSRLDFRHEPRISEANTATSEMFFLESKLILISSTTRRMHSLWTGPCLQVHFTSLYSNGEMPLNGNFCKGMRLRWPWITLRAGACEREELQSRINHSTNGPNCGRCPRPSTYQFCLKSD